MKIQMILGSKSDMPVADKAIKIFEQCEAEIFVHQAREALESLQ